MKVWKKNINSKNLLKKKNNQKNDDQIWYKKIKHDEIAKKQLKTILDIYIYKQSHRKKNEK